MDNEKIINKIKKLFALAQSPNLEEAELAMAKAHELLTRYNLTMQEVQNYKDYIQQEINDKSRCYKWEMQLATVVAKSFYTKTIRRHSTWDGFYETHIVFVGEKINVTISVYVYEFLHRKIKQLVAEHSKQWNDDLLYSIRMQFPRFKNWTDRRIKTELRRNYRFGLVDGIKTTLEKQKFAESKAGLIFVEDVELKTYIDKIINGKFDIGNESVGAGYNNGLEDGKKININPGITTNENDSLNQQTLSLENKNVT